MEEVIPVTSGVVLGLVLASLAPARLRPLLLGTGSVLAGGAASWLTGELAASWLYLLVDIGQVLVAGVLTAVLAARWRSHREVARRRA
jgi:hypothetical protein